MNSRRNKITLFASTLLAAFVVVAATAAGLDLVA
jgi:hypothetical protein